MKKEVNTEPRRILVHGEEDFVLEIPGDVRITFGPWSPPSDKAAQTRWGEKSLVGTLRLYKGTATTGNIVGLYTNITSFRDLDVKHIAVLNRGICNVCKQNLVEPGDDLCPSCNGHAKGEDVVIKSITTYPQVLNGVTI